MPSFSFGDFGYFCYSSSLPFCPALNGLSDPKCYSRNIDFSGFLLFQPAALVIDIVAIVMTLVMIYNIRRKYTAVGRKEMVIFFYMYALTILLDFLLVSNIVSAGSSAFKYFAAMYVGCVSTTFWVLLLNGLVGFQWAEDGTPWSLWSFRISGLAVFGASFLIATLTFLNTAGLGPKNSMILFIVFYLFNAGCFLVYVNLQIVLVLNTLDDRWPLGELLFGALFFIAAQVVVCVLSSPICQLAVHYVDGLFFANLLTLLSVMMVYKYWDSITKEDLEFSVPSNQLLLEEKEMILKASSQSVELKGPGKASSSREDAQPSSQT